MDNKEFIGCVERFQSVLGLNDVRFCEQIGYALSGWGRIKRGERQPTLGFIKGLAYKYPEMRSLIMEWLSS